MTLMEVLVATAILVFGMVSVLAALQAGLRAHKRARDETNAGFVAASVMAEMRGIFAMGRVPDAILESAPWESKDFAGYIYWTKLTDLTPARGVRGGAVLGREFFVEVRVYWQARTDEKKWLVFNTVMLLREPG